MATLDQHGAVTARLAYDPFGQRRHASGQYDAFGTLVVQWASTHAAGPERGYTGHEHLDDFGLIHMNGRLYEPATGRFLQPDPLIQDPLSLQNFNRYSYCFNSPTNCTDPTGYFSWSRLRDSLIRAGAMVLDAMGCSGFCSAAVYTHQGYRAGGNVGAMVAAITSYAGYQIGVAGDPATMGFFAAASGCVNALAAGGDCSGGVKAGAEAWLLGEFHAGVAGFQIKPHCLVACVAPDSEEHYASDVPMVVASLESNAPVIHTFVINGRLERTWWSSYREAVAGSIRSDPWFEVQRLMQGSPAAAAPAGFLWVSRAGDVSRQAAKVPIWSSTKKLSPVENALGHWNKHKAEFPELANAKQYVEAARSFAASPPAGTLTRSQGADTLIYHPASNTFLVRGADGAPRTMFRPDPAKHGYPTNLDFFHAK